MGKKTPLYDCHLAQKARMVDFAGWDMPVQYTSLIKEHNAVRDSAGMFDVSHMLAIDIIGSDSKAWLQTLLANDIGKLKTPGKALYSCMLNEQGGVIDDLITYFVADGFYRMVVNAGTREKDIAWMQSQIKDSDVTLVPRTELAIIAVQGPDARKKVLPLLTENLSNKAVEIKRFFSCSDGDWFVGRTGYTGEDGFEIILPAEVAADFWNALLQVDVKPIGLGARDTLRLEAGMNLYGNDMDETVDPLVSGLSWTVAFEPASRQFNGRSTLESIRDQLPEKLVGLVLKDKGILRSGIEVFSGEEKIGVITSGSFSPTTGKSIAFARIRSDVSTGVSVAIRGKQLAADIVRPPFVKQGKANF